jgi:hypothetical protein
MLDKLDSKEETHAPPREPRRDDPSPDPAPVQEPEAEAEDQAEDGDQGSDEGEGQAEEASGEEEASLNDAPEFWSAEDKAAWATVPPQLRPLIKKYEQQARTYAEGKAQEAAKVRHEAMEYAKQATGVVEEAAKWWQTNGPQFFQAFGDKWAGVDWNRLANDNPAEWARLKQQREVEADMLQQAHARGQRDIEAANHQANARLQEAKRTEHEKLAAKLPEYFSPAKAAKTYDDLGKFLYSVGIEPARINAIHEAPIIELALDAMRFRQGKKQVSGVLSGTPNTPAQRTPLRVAPGPAARPGSQGNERMRQASERIRRGDSVTTEQAAALMNSLKL